MSEQMRIVEVERHVLVVCSHCHATGRRRDHLHRIDDCLYDTETLDGAPESRRPDGCVNLYDPATAPIPY